MHSLPGGSKFKIIITQFNNYSKFLIQLFCGLYRREFMYSIFLIFVAVIPAIILCSYVYIKDRVEKEPFSLLLKLFFFGALCCFPAMVLELIFEIILRLFFAENILNLIDLSDSSNYNFACYLYIVLHNLFVVAIVEEGCKFFVLYKFTKKSKEFDSMFDGIIYAVFVSLGFAALENIFYVIENGITVGILRAVLSVPGHMFFAVMMGYFYSRCHIKDKAKMLENSLIKRGIIYNNKPLFNSKKESMLSLIIPIALHSTYNSCCSSGTTLSNVLLVVLVVFMYVYCFKKIITVSKFDTYENTYIMYMMKNKYQELNVINNNENSQLPENV